MDQTSPCLRVPWHHSRPRLPPFQVNPKWTLMARPKKQRQKKRIALRLDPLLPINKTSRPLLLRPLHRRRPPPPLRRRCRQTK